MAYFAELRDARDWLLQNRSADGGWGMTAGQGSSMVNTAEALLVLAKAGTPIAVCQPALNYLRNNLEPHLSERGSRTRYLSLPLAVLAECFPSFDPEFQRSLAKRLVAARNEDDGWGDDARDGESDVFSTYLAIEALSLSGTQPAEIGAAGRWILAQHKDTGWGLHTSQSYSISGTAYAVQALVRTGHSDTAAFRLGHEQLLSVDRWEPEEIVIPGAKWLHCRSAAIVRALIASGTDPFHPTVAEGIRAFQRCVHPGSGWTETPNENSPTIRSQYWAASALDRVWQVLDPAIYIPRVDAERTQGVLLEPSYLPFATGTRFHTIVPAIVFRAIVWGLLVGGLLASSNLLAHVHTPAPGWAVATGVIMVVAATVLVRKRPKQFRYLHPFVRYAVLLAAVLGAVFGTSAAQLLSGFWQHARAYLGLISGVL